ncbi:hypothetical protein BHM03_00062536 [Ensete ventricosum]|nr:hypothetical protein BHM03_00062536 [Ensete ventricosum]
MVSKSRPPTGVASHGHGPLQRGCRLQLGQPAVEAARKRQPPATSLRPAEGGQPSAAKHDAHRQAAYGQKLPPARVVARRNARRGGAHGGVAHCCSWSQRQQRTPLGREAADGQVQPHPAQGR